MRIIRKLLFALVIYLAAGWIYGQVFPEATAHVVAAVLALIELCSAAIAPGGGTGPTTGGSLRVLFRLGASFTIWPILVLGLEYAGFSDRPARIALAAAAAATLGVFAARHGNGRDSLRLQAVLIAVALPLYGIGQAITAVPFAPAAMALGCVGVGVALLVTRQAIVWPRQHERVALMLACASLTAGVFCSLHSIV